MATLQYSDERVYIQVTHPFETTIPNSSGTATVANGDLVPVQSLELNLDSTVIPSGAKTSGLGRLPGIAGRRTGRWSGVFPFQPSGAAGTAPNVDPILQAVFGQAPTVTPGTSVAYSFSDSGTPSSLTIWSFRPAASNVFQRVARGCLVDTFSISTGDGELVLNVGGPCCGILDSVNFASYDTVDKGGLSAFPSEPSTPTSTGSSIPNFLGSATIDGVSTHQIESFAVNVRLNRTLRYVFSQRVPSVPISQLRDVLLSLGIYEEATANLAALRFNPYERDRFGATLVFGDTAGSIATFTFGEIVLPSETLDVSNNESIVRFNDAQAHISAAGENDEMTLTLT